MRVSRDLCANGPAPRTIVIIGLLLACALRVTAEQPLAAQDASKPGNGVAAPTSACEPSILGSPYIPVDSWVYPAVMRLYSLGYVDSTFLGLRPWTRAGVMHMLEEAGNLIEVGESSGDPGAAQAREISDSLTRELHYDMEGPCGPHKGSVRIESVYSVARAISGTPLHDSYHLGQTVVNDYGRPFENGFNNYSGASSYASAGRFALYLRAEFQGAPSAAGYSPTLADTLSNVDEIGITGYNQTTIPQGPIFNSDYARFLEAYVSYQYLDHVFSFGKQDQWLGPAQGASMAFSNNAQNFYSFEINRIEPLNVPFLSKLTGPFRYEFLVGALRGHTYIPSPQYELNPSPDIPNVNTPGDPWVHVEKVSFKPYKDLEFGFERTVIWGGEGHSPVTLHNFLKSFFSLQNVPFEEKDGRGDPGARFGAFDFTWRLPYLRKWLTLYADSEAHDDVSPISAPRRAAYRPGLFLSHVPGASRFDLRVEGVSTDPPTSRSNSGAFMYFEGVEKQGYTNQGQLFGDWIGREDKGGQAWVTYHLKGNEWIQAGFRHQKAARDFIPGGTTLNDFNVRVVKRLRSDLEIDGNFAFEHYKAPVYLPGEQTVTTTNIQVTWFPGRKVTF
jgi:Capsule assembly protein Wzi